MLARVSSGALRGIDAILVAVEVDVSSGLPHTTTVGLPDGAVREASDRIRAALRNAGLEYPTKRVTVNLAPAGVRKEGAAFDLPIALGILAADGKTSLPALDGWCVLGELGLDGRVHAVRGALSIATAARRAALKGLIVPAANAPEAALLGGGNPIRPGEVTLAHRGVLFMDELPEFRRNALEPLRQPLEERRITVARGSGAIHYPSAFQLVAAMNPCVCGWLGDASDRCRCTPPMLDRYRARVSGPLLDRIDLHVEVPRVSVSSLAEDTPATESSAAIRVRVLAARARATIRLARLGLAVNAHI